MKKVKTLVVLCLTALLLFGCGTDVPPTVPTTAPIQPTAMPTDPTTEPTTAPTTVPPTPSSLS